MTLPTRLPRNFACKISVNAPGPATIARGFVACSSSALQVAHTALIVVQAAACTTQYITSFVGKQKRCNKASTAGVANTHTDQDAVVTKNSVSQEWCIPIARMVTTVWVASNKASASQANTIERHELIDEYTAVFMEQS